MKRILTILLTCLTLALTTACNTKTKSSVNDHPVVVIKVKNYGDITVKLDRTQAPITVDNFIKLVNEKFYDGLTFHRIIDTFMIQGGDPKGDGTGGSKKTIKGEFSQNGVENNISHTRGTISMARSSDYNSASSQFFIMQDDNTGLDGQYAAFGKVTKGMHVVDQIAWNTPVLDNNGTVAKDQQPVIESIRVKK
ncbi:MAG TPA: peptidylprolyl isomerase [Erysipelotrichaceae bacterium]|nr:peptidylprolyl isomerase [Erysipelotrichaceae bacterium]HAV19171.1 peptidylprolyl isomerase [Erysipelotrichaceae bacterium]HBG84515.1 peptidylprolyl isomerase [Erysipelotrichaceae bacterium]HBZ50999.1 peptidylprolyl isomerase [Erysipelotrichaceae bacterium]HBZ88877.1 peptidylprolyl isomerase [Erysipelotrichaceae bacterium]